MLGACMLRREAMPPAGNLQIHDCRGQGWSIRRLCGEGGRSCLRRSASRPKALDRACPQGPSSRRGTRQRAWCVPGSARISGGFSPADTRVGGRRIRSGGECLTGRTGRGVLTGESLNEHEAGNGGDSQGRSRVGLLYSGPERGAYGGLLDRSCARIAKQGTVGRVPSPSPENGPERSGFRARRPLRRTIARHGVQRIVRFAPATPARTAGRRRRAVRRAARRAAAGSRPRPCTPTSPPSGHRPKVRRGVPDPPWHPAPVRSPAPREPAPRLRCDPETRPSR